MDRKIIRFEYEFDFWSPGQHDPDDLNSNVWVYFDDGTRWCATFYTFRNIEMLRKKNEQSGELLNGKYFVADHMILIDRLTKGDVESVVNDMIEAKEFDHYFELLEPDEDDEDDAHDGEHSHST